MEHFEEIKALIGERVTEDDLKCVDCYVHKGFGLFIPCLEPADMQHIRIRRIYLQSLWDNTQRIPKQVPLGTGSYFVKLCRNYESKLAFLCL